MNLNHHIIENKDKITPFLPQDIFYAKGIIFTIYSQLHS